MERAPLPARTTLNRSPEAPSRLAGAVLAERYQLVQLLGSGGMGEVWEARHLLLDRLVAIKLLQHRTRGVAERLLREARLLARLHHPAIVEVHDCGLLPDEVPFLVMERLRGETLAEALGRGPLPPPGAARLFLTVLEGLGAAHRAGVIHRDLKPDNIFLVDPPAGRAVPPASPAAGARIPKLLDFGIAIVGDEVELQRTAPGSLLGTPAYMAPEQFRGQRADERSDVWAVTASLYEAVTGAPPFGCDSLAEVMRRVQEAPLPFPRGGAVQLDGALWALLARGLRKRPEERFPSVEALAAELAAWLELRTGERAALPPSSTPAAPPPPPGAPPEELIDAAHAPTQPLAPRLPRPTLDEIIRRKLTPAE